MRNRNNRISGLNYLFHLRSRVALWMLMGLCPLIGLPGAWASVIDPNRSIDWSQAGVTGGIPRRTTICATFNPDTTAAQINAAIANCPSGQVVKLNAGTYNLNTGIIFNNKSNVTLRGAGPDQTFLVFSGGNSCGGLGGDICFITPDNGDGGDDNFSNLANWTGGYSVGTTSITLNNVSRGSMNSLQVGSVIYLDQLDDATDTGQVYVCQAADICSMQGGSRNGRPGRGQNQPVRVISISGSGPWTIGISPDIRMPNIASGKSPQAWWDNGLPVQNDGKIRQTILMQLHALAAQHDDDAHGQNSAKDESASRTLPQGTKPDTLD